jgi:hypothetical protein
MVMKNSQQKRARSMTELMLAQRGSWWGVNPVTRVVRDKTKYTRKVKHVRDVNSPDDSVMCL